MTQRKKRKICLVGECLSAGGAERVQAVLSDYFTNEEIEVHHVIFINRIKYAFSGRLLNLGEIEGATSMIKKIKSFVAFRSYIRKHQFSVIIDSRVKYSSLHELIINKLIYNKRTYFLIHSSKLELYFPNSKWLATLLYGKGKRVIGVSDGISSEIRKKFNWKKVKTIYNPVDTNVLDMYSNGKIPVEGEYILYAGRIDEVKQIDQLISTYMKSKLIDKGVKLIIIGEGKLLNNMQDLVVQNKWTDYVIFKKFQSNPYSYMKNAKFLVLSSQYEGFGNVLVESLATGTPVISFDCDYGPKEIIQHEQNGLLVENQNFDALKTAMERLFSDAVLYRKCKSNARSSVQKFLIDSIGQQWLKKLKLKKRNK